ncbi:MAG: imidazoleglycerol-phosphate dehydratase HisB [Anaerolineaceae bacterium]|nr:imidazoleglycerol-phosphate dehydratase HisB [Anaerolineaceae bacterium]
MAWTEEVSATEALAVNSLQGGGRCAAISRQTRETSLQVFVELDGSGQRQISTGVGFFDHMLEQLCTHGGFDLDIHAQGDLEIDPHHTVEDVALALGEAFNRALGERRGIRRCGWALFPLDEALAEVVVDFSGRPYTVFQAGWITPASGGVHNSLWEHFFASFAQRAGCNIHAVVRYGRDDHHQVEALFKALARALAAAVEIDPRRSQQVLSSKGTVSV